MKMPANEIQSKLLIKRIIKKSKFNKIKIMKKGKKEKN